MNIQRSIRKTIRQIRQIRRIGRIGLIFVALSVGAQDADNVLEASGVKGGLVVVLGAENAPFLADLQAAGPYVVQALETDAVKVAKARQALQDMGVYGPVSVVEWNGDALPYTDNLVNLVLVASGECSSFAKASADKRVAGEEIERVLAPGGVSLIINQQSSISNSSIKPRPAKIDDWTHYLRDASGNAVAKDTVVAPPRRIHWRNHPHVLRAHEQNNSIMNVITAGGRLFYFHDINPIGVWDDRFPKNWDLVARDAFSGVELWRRPLTKWSWLEWVDTGPEPRGIENLWGSPLTTNRRMVIDEAGKRLYVTPAYRSNIISVLDPATGKTLDEFDAQGDVDEMVLADDSTLYLRVRDIPVRTEKYGTKNKKIFADVILNEPPEEVVAMNAENGRILWRTKAAHIAPETLTAASNTVAYYNYEEVVALDRDTGKERWHQPAKGFQRGTFVRRYAGMVVLYKDTVLFGAGPLRAFDMATGEKLFEGSGRYSAMGFYAPGQLAVIDDCVWGSSGSGRLHYRTGQPCKDINIGNLISPGHHQRCYRSKATVRYILNAKRGVEFIDTVGENHMRNDWVRSTCGHGLVPANGMLYNPPSPCKCYAGVQVDWFNAVKGNPDHSTGPAPVTEIDEGRTIKGAIDQPFINQQSSISISSSCWPMHRHDARRSGWAPVAAPAEPKIAWTANLGAPPKARGSDAVSDLTQPVIADGKLYLSKKSTHQIVCLDAESGAEHWRFTAGAPIDSSPTVVSFNSPDTGLCFFGSDDGWVYAVHADTGQLVWKFRAAPEERRIMDCGAVRSAWPAHGSLVLQDGVLFCSAGRSTYLDGGIFIYGLDPLTGEIVHRLNLNGPWPDVIQEPGHCTLIDGTLSDLLVSDGKNLHMLAVSFTTELRDIDHDPGNVLLGSPQSDMHILDRPFIKKGGVEEEYGLDRKMPMHLTASSGLLNESGFNRIHWYYSGIWQRTDSRDASKEGNMLVFDENNTYGVKMYYGPGFSPNFNPANNEMLLFADSNSNEPEYIPTHEHPKGVRHYKLGRGNKALWQTSVPVLINAMTITGTPGGDQRLVVAGPPDVMPDDDPLAAFEGRAGGTLMIVDAAKGEFGATIELDAPPVWDGLSAAHGKLFLSLANGKILCLE